MLNYCNITDIYSTRSVIQIEGTHMRLLKSLTRGLHALDFLREKGSPVRLTDVAVELEVEKSNASHLLKTLVAAGYVRQTDTRQYVIRENLFHEPVGGGKKRQGLEAIIACKERWQPVLRRFVEETGECAHMAVLVKSRVWYVDKIDSTLPLKVDHPIGSLSPLHCTALGKAFLAFGRVEEIAELSRYTPKTITSRGALEEEISLTRRRGYAVDDEEFAPGIRCVARPVDDEEGEMIAAVGISGPTVRIDDERLAQLGALITEVSAPQMVEA
jgi:DNA-binding IclR family transcriptional regulator